ncbi:hypothetical protein GKC30_06220 [Pseudodesulfovibrio sp. F-1]|uniref:Uncharacterized protein n=1 Tax=Pseudodesulfovibrio alkaliphilus TaxID=2661613 RepID=A0A7K1KMC6_9BACT|nr:hypothetical protein [Pseudodesulfovibrio alkaliphilus]MUM77225.1 hypothetical protein [Pseudodesulfovibrio alkaliphilus]
MEDNPGRYALTLVCALIAIPLSLLLDKKLHQKHPEAKPYKWGYYTGLMGMLTYGLLALTLVVTSAVKDQKTLTALVFFTLSIIPYYYIIMRRKWAWVVGVILLFNPILWIVNAVYARNRWKEMPVPTDDPDEPATEGTPEAGNEPPRRQDEP